MCTNKSRNISLPEQEKLCTNSESACRYIEMKTGWTTWEKRLAIIVEDEPTTTTRLVIYKKPLLGGIYILNDLKKLQIRKEINSSFIIKLVTNNKQSIELKIDGKDAGLWIAAIIGANCKYITHSTHEPFVLASQKRKKNDKNELENQLKDKSDNNNYTGSRQGYKLPHKDELNRTQSSEAKDSKPSSTENQLKKKKVATEENQENKENEDLEHKMKTQKESGTESNRTAEGNANPTGNAARKTSSDDGLTPKAQQGSKKNSV